MTNDELRARERWEQTKDAIFGEWEPRLSYGVRIRDERHQLGKHYRKIAGYQVPAACGWNWDWKPMISKGNRMKEKEDGYDT